METSEKDPLLPYKDDLDNPYKDIGGKLSYRNFIIGICVFVCIVFNVSLFVYKYPLNERKLNRIDFHTRYYPNGSMEYLPKLCDSAKQQSGYIKISEKIDDHYFYWFFESRNFPEKSPLVLWLTGGPGCSSMFALLKENGPCHVDPSGRILINNTYSWTNVANMLWLDQPTGVGFSYGNKEDNDYNETDVGRNIWYFLQGFFKRNPEYIKNDFYIIGESYGGHYVPATAYYIHKENEYINDKVDIKINLKGIGIGNGITDTIEQSRHFLDMSIDNSYNIELVGTEELLILQENSFICTKLIIRCQKDINACIAASEFCVERVMAPLIVRSERNPYDIRLPCNYMNSMKCYDDSKIIEFLNDPIVQKKLHVDTNKINKWKECNVNIHMQFLIDSVRSFNYTIPPLLESNISVLIYAGDADLMCNWIGNKAWITKLLWKNTKEFNSAIDIPYQLRSNNKNVGEIRHINNLAFLRVYNAGHMVPMDQPEVALQLFKDFINGNLTSS